jgi:hypothetical protein
MTNHHISELSILLLNTHSYEEITIYLLTFHNNFGGKLQDGRFS